jgi:prepilin-type N-terminal cleavage/methylation domain-containing protein
MLTGRQSRPTSRLDRRTGFTLIELVVAMAIFSIVLFSAMLALNMTFSVGLRNRRRSEAQEDISAALEQIARQLRQAKSVDVPALLPIASRSTSIQSAGTGVAILTFTDINGNVVSYSAAVPTDAAEIIPAVGGFPNYQLMATSGASAAQAMTGQNVTSFTAERPLWSNNIVIITLQSQQMNASGTKTSPLTVMNMVTLRQ